MEPMACQANNIQEILTKNWSEEENAYNLMSAITDKRETRIKDLISQNRYGGIF